MVLRALKGRQQSVYKFLGVPCTVYHVRYSVPCNMPLYYNVYGIGDRVKGIGIGYRV